MTAGILVYGSFLVLFVAAVGFATVHRLRTRRAFRLKQMAIQEGPGRGNDDGESGRRGLPRGLVGGIGGMGEKGMYMDEDLKLEFGDEEKENMGAARGMEDEEDRYTYPNRSELFKKASMSRKALMSDAAPAATSPPLKAATIANANTPSARAAKRASSSSTSSSRSKRLSSAQEYDIYTSGSRGGVMTPAAAVAALDRPKAAISNPVVHFEDTDSTMGSILISRPSFSKTTSIASSTALEHMTSYSPEPVLLEIDDDESDYSSPPLRESPSSLDTTYKILTSPPPAVYQSRGQQGYMAPTLSSTTQQKRQSPPPPPKSLKRLSPVSTAGLTLAKNYQQAHPIASTAKMGPTKTSTAPVVSTAALTRSNTLRTGFTAATSTRGTNNNGLKRSSSASTTSSLASSKTGRSGNIYYNASHYGRSEFSPADNRKEADTDKYPVPVLRSNSTRLPLEMRKGGAPAAPAATATTAGYSNDASNYF
ncbi:hypothetical protein BGZ88_004398 [Linnemannia elongata]|nr:hypothetical protein BGZ88_004398 [Linnemannia elongata]KAG0067707.1 hypothetical protein BGZ89_005767 [Linnemannia elongata]